MERVIEKEEENKHVSYFSQFLSFSSFRHFHLQVSLQFLISFFSSSSLSPFLSLASLFFFFSCFFSCFRFSYMKRRKGNNNKNGTRLILPLDSFSHSFSLYLSLSLFVKGILFYFLLFLAFLLLYFFYPFLRIEVKSERG